MQLGTIEAAISELKNSGIVGMPTETVYGLAAKIDDIKAVQKIFSTKKRPFFDPLIVHVSDIEMAKALTTEWSELAQALAEKFWPGPLTMVLPKSSRVIDSITAGLGSVGIRMPNHPMALELIKKMGVPLAAPSANRFGKTSPTKAMHVLAEFPLDPGIVLDGGDCIIGLESTVLLIQKMSDIYQLCILRAGRVSESQIRSAIAEKKINFVFLPKADKQLAPGQMKHHYMPDIPLVVVKGNSTEQEILEKAKQRISSMPDRIDEVEIRKPKKFNSAKEVILDKDPSFAARHFYSQLREMSAQNTDILYIRISKDHETELWQPLMDRLLKAASLIF